MKFASEVPLCTNLPSEGTALFLVRFLLSDARMQQVRLSKKTASDTLFKISPVSTMTDLAVSQSARATVDPTQIFYHIKFIYSIISLQNAISFGGRKWPAMVSTQVKNLFKILRIDRELLIFHNLRHPWRR